jgi:Tol biopolymer transport system component
MNKQLLFIMLIVASQSNVVAQEVKPYAPELFPVGISGGVCGFSPNAKIIYFVKSDSISKKNFIYQAKWKKGKWRNPELLHFSGTNNDYGGRLSQDGKTFYFTSDRPSGSTREDDNWNIWVSKLENGKWSIPKPLSVINNKSDECCPTPLPDGSLLFSGNRASDWAIQKLQAHEESVEAALTDPKGWQWPSFYDEKTKTLFLSSMRQPDVVTGMDDIYVSYVLNGNWTKPKNIGPPVNSKAYEDGPILTRDGKWLIFNRHETPDSPSQVLVVSWDEIKKSIE